MRLILSSYMFTNDHKNDAQVEIKPSDVVVQMKVRSTAFRTQATKALCFDAWGFQAQWPAFAGMLRCAEFAEVVEFANDLATLQASTGVEEEREVAAADDDDGDDDNSSAAAAAGPSGETLENVVATPAEEGPSKRRRKKV